MSDQEKKNRRIGILTSLGIHGALFLIFFFMMAWRAPNPPLPEYGIELNFGLDDQGSGDIQPETPVGADTELQADTPAEHSESTPEESRDEVKEESKTEPSVEKVTEQVVSKTESPVAVKEEKKDSKTDVVKEKPVESKPKEQVLAEYKKEEKKESAEEASKKGEQGSHGDDANKPGDKGSPEGKLDAKALYGTPGGGGGGNGMDLQMAGWAWADQPQIPDLPDNENGKVIFEIECDESGEITGITTLERSLSPKSEQILKNEIRKNSLVRTSGGRVPEKSKGRIVFILKTR